jgi:hypothetical protein
MKLAGQNPSADPLAAVNGVNDEDGIDIPAAAARCAVCNQPLLDVADLRSRFRTLAKKHHPDAGGSAAKFRMLKECYDELLEESGGGADVQGRCAACVARAERSDVHLVSSAPRN